MLDLKELRRVASEAHDSEEKLQAYWNQMDRQTALSLLDLLESQEAQLKLAIGRFRILKEECLPYPELTHITKFVTEALEKLECKK